MLVRILVLGGALTLAGCQTVIQAEQPDAIAVETETLSSNELNTIARRDLEAGNNGLAERHFRAAVEKNSEDSASWIGLAAAYDNLRRFELADRAYGQAVRLAGETVAIINNRGYSYFLRGDRARALVNFRRALKLRPGDPTLLNNIEMAQTGEKPNRASIP